MVWLLLRLITIPFCLGLTLRQASITGTTLFLRLFFSFSVELSEEDYSLPNIYIYSMG